MYWINKNHFLFDSVLLDEKDEKANPLNFKGRLFIPQKTLLKTMIDLENVTYINVDDNILKTQKARISEKPSFGKTIVILALICTQSPKYTNKIVKSFSSDNKGYYPEIHIEYKKSLRQTFVLANSAIISQWENETKRFTDLSFFTIENVKSLKEFENIYLSDNINQYDIIFIKTGRVTSNYQTKGEDVKLTTKNRSIIEAINNILDGVIISRLIVDDFDTLKLSSDDCFTPAMFTWLISATCRITTSKNNIKFNQDSIDDFFKNNMQVPILTAAHDQLLNKPLSIRCDPEYVDKYINSTHIVFRKINVKGGVAASLLKDLDIPNEVIEMINANAINTAAQTLGIDATDVGSVIKKLVGNQLQNLQKSIRTLNRIEIVKNKFKDSKNFDESNKLDESNKFDEQKDSKFIRKIIKNGTDEEFNSLVLSKEDIKMIISMESKARIKNEKYSIPLNRMRDNIREGCCQCCKITFEEGEPAFIIIGCCQIIVCETCITIEEKSKKTFINRCPNCAHDVKINSDIMRVGKEIELNLVLENESVLETKNAQEEPINETDHKVKALIQFMGHELHHIENCNEKKIECISNIISNPFINGLLEGNLNKNWPHNKQKKYLIFTMHSESTTYLHKKLTSYNIPHCILRGTRIQKDEIIQRVKRDINVILVTAAKDCGGINMPFLSHIIFYHHVVDPNVELQVAGRGQRQGREYNLEIVKLLNESEN